MNLFIQGIIFLAQMEKRQDEASKKKARQNHEQNDDKGMMIKKFVVLVGNIEIKVQGWI